MAWLLIGLPRVQVVSVQSQWYLRVYLGCKTIGRQLCIIPAPPDVTSGWVGLVLGLVPAPCRSTGIWYPPPISADTSVSCVAHKQIIKQHRPEMVLLDWLNVKQQTNKSFFFVLIYVSSSLLSGKSRKFSHTMRAVQ